MIREWREDPDVVDANQTWKVSATMKSKTRKLVLTMSVGLHVGAEKGWYTVVHGYDDNFLQCRLFNLFQWKVFLSKISICKTKLNYGNTSYLYTTGVTHCVLVFSKMFKADQNCTPFVVFFISYNFSSSYFYPQMYIVYHESYLKQSTTHRSFGKQSCLGWLLFQFFLLMFIFLFPVTSSRVVLLPVDLWVLKKKIYMMIKTVCWIPCALYSQPWHAVVPRKILNIFWCSFGKTGNPFSCKPRPLSIYILYMHSKTTQSTS